jgi:hypothetical protein
MPSGRQARRISSIVFLYALLNMVANEKRRSPVTFVSGEIPARSLGVLQGKDKTLFRVILRY